MNCFLYVNTEKISETHMAAINEYTKRLSTYCSVKVTAKNKVELPKDINKPDHRLLIIKKGTSTHSSTDLADYINHIQISGISTLHVAIGIYDFSSNPDILSISAFDMSAETSALLFMEQLYRGYTIITGKTYHK